MRLWVCGFAGSDPQEGKEGKKTRTKAVVMME